jgi:hypothetical protein
MSGVTRTAGVMVGVALANMIQYRAVMLLWAAWGIVSPLVSLAVWTAAGRGRELGGYDPGELAGYFFVTMVIAHLTTAWDVEVLSWMVRSGQLSSRLLRPLHPVWQSVADNVGYKLCTSTVLLPIWALLWWRLQPTLHLTPERALWLVPAVLLSACLTFTWGYCVLDDERPRVQRALLDGDALYGGSHGAARALAGVAPGRGVGAPVPLDARLPRGGRSRPRARRPDPGWDRLAAFLVSRRDMRLSPHLVARHPPELRRGSVTWSTCASSGSS